MSLISIYNLINQLKKHKNITHEHHSVERYTMHFDHPPQKLPKAMTVGQNIFKQAKVKEEK